MDAFYAFFFSLSLRREIDIEAGGCFEELLSCGFSRACAFVKKKNLDIILYTGEISLLWDHKVRMLWIMYETTIALRARWGVGVKIV